MTEPSEETLRDVYGAHIGHIAQMKADSLSFLRWTIGLTASFVGLSFGTLRDFEEFKPIAAILITSIAVFCLVFVIYTQKKLREARGQIEQVETKLRLREHPARTASTAPRERRRTAKAPGRLHRCSVGTQGPLRRPLEPFHPTPTNPRCQPRARFGKFRLGSANVRYEIGKRTFRWMHHNVCF